MDKVVSYLRQTKLSFYFLLIVVYSVGFTYYIAYYSRFNINIINYLTLNEVIVVSIGGLIATVLFIVVLFFIEYYIEKLILKKTKIKDKDLIDLLFYIGTFNFIASTIFSFITPLKTLSIPFGLAYVIYLSYSLSNRYLKIKFQQEIKKMMECHEKKLSDFQIEDNRIKEQFKEKTSEYYSALKKLLSKTKKRQKEFERLRKIIINGNYSNFNKETKNISLKINLLVFSLLTMYLLFQSANLATFHSQKVIKKEPKYSFEIVLNNDAKLDNVTNQSFRLIGETHNAFFVFDSQTKNTSTILKDNVVLYNISRK